jgi:hypothetical protein
MGWTPPSKFTVMVSFLLCAFAIFILYDWTFLAPDGNGILIETDLEFGDFDVFQSWMIIAMVVVFLSWFLMFLGVRLTGL